MKQTFEQSNLIKVTPMNRDRDVTVSSFRTIEEPHLISTAEACDAPKQHLKISKQASKQPKLLKPFLKISRNSS
jgi:hypothetical protein